MLKILIVDDEEIVLSGLKHIVDFEALNIHLCGTATDGQEALAMILETQPDIVLMDITMPVLSGLDVIKFARKMSFTGHFIILSGYTKFEYAQQAMKYNVKYYLTKPIDEEELTTILKELVAETLALRTSDSHLDLLEKNHRSDLLTNLLLNDHPVDESDRHRFKLAKGPYRILIINSLTRGVKNSQRRRVLDTLMAVDNATFEHYEELSIDGRDVILLKGETTVAVSSALPYHARSLTDVFISSGRSVQALSSIRESYRDALFVLENRFFLPSTTHLASTEDLPHRQEPQPMMPELFQRLSQQLIQCVWLKKEDELDYTIQQLGKQLVTTALTIKDMRYFLIDFYLEIKHEILNKSPNITLDLFDNSYIMSFITTEAHLDTILTLIGNQLHIMSEKAGTVSNQTIIENITFHIQHNYHKNLTLKYLSALFGYNSSYLGKLFKKNVGMNFNQYLDQVRISEAKKILAHQQLKIYEVATEVGYDNVDYFYKKFKSLENISPVEYRKKMAHE